MSERPDDSSRLTPGDPLGGHAEPPPPGVPPSEPTRGGLWSDRAEAAPGYTSPPPPGAGGVAAPAAGVPGSGQLVLATWGSRVAAQLIDGLIIGVGALVLFLILGAVFSLGFSAGEETGAISLIVGLLLWFVCVAIIALLYAPTLMARTNGQTWGRQVMNIRVVRKSREPVTFGFAVLREVVIKSLLVGGLSSVTFGVAYLLDVLWPLWDEENRALHDFVVQTRTVRS